MSESCNHDCSNCSENCENRESKSFLANSHELSNVKKVIGIVSGKGGVGKSLVTGITSVLANREGYKTAVLDADITGPSIPKMFGIKERALASSDGIFPIITSTGIKVMSLNLLVENESDPVVWRGPMIGSAVKQFWTDVIWDDVDFMFVDMPPGTSDVALTVFQSMPLDGIIVVTSPQDLVSMIVEKALKMANMMNIPVLGIIENLSYIKCEDCGKKINVFGESHLEQITKTNNIPSLGQIPINPNIAACCDAGNIEYLDDTWLDDASNNIINLITKL